MEKPTVKKYQLPWGGTLTVVGIADTVNPPGITRIRKPVVFQDEPEKEFEGKWRPLMFTEDGKSYRAITTYDSEKETIQAIVDFEKQLSSLLPEFWWVHESLNGPYFIALYTHAIPMPEPKT